MPFTRLAPLLVLAVPITVCAQESMVDSTPFHAGEWAAQFTGLFTGATVGVLRFTSPRSAWLLDVRVSGGHDHSETTFPGPSGDTTVATFASNAGLSLRAGRRVYRVARRPVVGFFGFGALAGVTHSAGGSAGTGGETNGWSAGAFAEAGGTYLVSDHLGLGATAEVTFIYLRSKSTSTPPPVRRTSWSYSASTPNLRFAATIYF